MNFSVLSIEDWTLELIFTVFFRIFSTFHQISDLFRTEILFPMTFTSLFPLKIWPKMVNFQWKVKMAKMAILWISVISGIFGQFWSISVSAGSGVKLSRLLTTKFDLLQLYPCLGENGQNGHFWPFLTIFDVFGMFSRWPKMVIFGHFRCFWAFWASWP